jgi:hypothetical protein
MQQGRKTMHPRGVDKNVRGKAVSATADVQTASGMLSRIEAIEGRPHLAKRLRASPGTLENLRRLRLKTVPSWLMDRLRAELVAVLSNEVRKLEHEIHIHRQIGSRHSDDDLRAAEAQIAAAKKILGSEG